MSTRIEDSEGRTLSIDVSIFKGKFRLVTTNGDRCTIISPKSEDAPAVALAILEAAGIKPAWDEHELDPVDRWSSKAAEALTYCVKHEAERAEREAEDAKDRAFRESDQRARGVNPDAFPWEGVQPQERSSWRARRLAAREFFQQEVK